MFYDFTNFGADLCGNVQMSYDASEGVLKRQSAWPNRHITL